MRIQLAKTRLFLMAVALITLIPAWAMVFAGSAGAQDNTLDRLFTIQEIKVDETAARASEARQTAFAKAEDEAYFKLVRKLTQPEGRALLPELSAAERQGMISGIEVVDEQSSSRRYVATLNVRFEPARVSAFFAKYHVPHVLGTGGGIMVLHGHSRGLSNILWETDPVLKVAQSSVDWLNRIRQYRFPQGAVRERLTISYEEVAAFDTKPALELAGQYGVQSALMIESHYGPYGLRYRYMSTDGGAEGTGLIEDAADEPAALIRMYDDVLDRIDSAWREQLLVDTAVSGDLTVLVPSTTLPVLAEVQKRLATISLVQDFQVVSIAMPFSRIHVRYSGREDQLIMALRYAGLNLGLYGTERLLELKSGDK